MNKTYKYKAFISYSHKDKFFAKWLHKSIENYKIPKYLREKYPHLPKDLKRSVFRDDEELSSAVVLSNVLKSALGQSQNLIVVCSPASLSSQWVEDEIIYFQEQHTPKDIFAIVKNGEPSEVLPAVLRVENEPLAVDARTHRKMAVTKIVAAILNVDFADLWEREKKEFQKTIFVKSIFLLLFLSIGLYAYLQFRAISSNSELEGINTEIVQIEARLEKQKITQKEVYRLSERLKRLEDLKKVKEETLKWFGMLKTSVAKKAKAVYDEKGVEEAIAILESDKSRGEDVQYAKKNMLRAKLYIENNEYQKADTFYEKAVVLDDSYVNVYDYALFLMKENEFEKSKVLLEKLKEYDLGNVQKANVLNRLGITYRNLEHFSEAEDAYLKALDLRKILASENPEKHNLDLAWTYNNLGVLYKERNALSRAENVHFKAFELRKDLAKQNPKKYTFYVTCSLHNLGELYASMDDVNKAETFFVQSLKIRRILAKENPEKYMPPLASTLHQLAVLNESKNELVKAEKFYMEALKFRRILAKENPKAYEDDLMKTFKGLKELYKKSGQIDKSEAMEKEIKNAA